MAAAAGLLGSPTKKRKGHLERTDIFSLRLLRAKTIKIKTLYAAFLWNGRDWGKKSSYRKIQTTHSEDKPFRPKC